MLFQRYVDRLQGLETKSTVPVPAWHIVKCLVYLTNTMLSAENMAVNNSQKFLPSWSLHSSGEKQTINNNGMYTLDYDKCHCRKKEDNGKLLSCYKKKQVRYVGNTK